MACCNECGCNQNSNCGVLADVQEDADAHLTQIQTAAHHQGLLLQDAPAAQDVLTVQTALIAQTALTAAAATLAIHAIPAIQVIHAVHADALAAQETQIPGVQDAQTKTAE